MTNTSKFPDNITNAAYDILTGKRETDARGGIAALLVALINADTHKHRMKRVRTPSELRKYGPNVWSYCTVCKGHKYSKGEKGLTWG